LRKISEYNVFSSKPSGRRTPPTPVVQGLTWYGFFPFMQPVQPWSPRNFSLSRCRVFLMVTIPRGDRTGWCFSTTPLKRDPWGFPPPTPNGPPLPLLRRVPPFPPPRFRSQFPWRQHLPGFSPILPGVHTSPLFLFSPFLWVWQFSVPCPILLTPFSLLFQFNGVFVFNSLFFLRF